MSCQGLFNKDQMVFHLQKILRPQVSKNLEKYNNI